MRWALTALIALAAVTIEPAQSPAQDGHPKGQSSAESGDRTAMKEIVKRSLASIIDAGTDGSRFSGIPNEVDQVQLVMELVADGAKDDRGKWIRFYGVQWLTQTKDPRAEEFAAARALDEREDIDVRGTALLGLAGHCPDRALPIMQTLIRSPDASIRHKVAHALINLRRPEAKGMCERLLNDPDPLVQAAARGTLLGLRDPARSSPTPNGEGPPGSSMPSVPSVGQPATSPPGASARDGAGTRRAEPRRSYWVVGATIGLLAGALLVLGVLRHIKRSRDTSRR